MAVDRQMEIEDMLASIDEILEQSKSVPFSDKVMVERSEIMEITKEIRLRLPTEIEQSKWVLEEKNRILARKVDYLAQRTTRQRLLVYLSEQAQRAGSAEFTIPFNRQQLADFLSVERSAMSAELSRMQAEGLLETERSHFRLK